MQQQAYSHVQDWLILDTNEGSKWIDNITSTIIQCLSWFVYVANFVKPRYFTPWYKPLDDIAICLLLRKELYVDILNVHKWDDARKILVIVNLDHNFNHISSCLCIKYWKCENMIFSRLITYISSYLIRVITCFCWVISIVVLKSKKERYYRNVYLKFSIY